MDKSMPRAEMIGKWRSKLALKRGAVISIGQGLPDPLDLPLLSETKKKKILTQDIFSANICFHASNFDCSLTKFRLLHELVQGSYIPAASPGIFVGGGRRFGRSGP